MVLPSELFTVSTTILSWPLATLLVAAAAAASSWALFTASSSASPLATLLILLPPLLRPSEVRLTGCLPSAGVMVMPLPLITVLPPSTLAKVALLRLVNVLFSATLIPSASALVVMLSSPFTARLSPSFFAPVLPLSPAKVRPLLSTASLAATPLAMSSLASSVRSSA